MTHLPQVTVIAIAGSRQAETIAALYKTLGQIKPARAVLLTNINITATGIECINVGGLATWEAYNHFCIKELTKYFDTAFALVMQWDGFVLNGEMWDDDFELYDYTGAKWLDIGKPYNVGNGGFSLRSKNLQNILAEDDFIKTTTPEDVSICRLYGQYLMDKYDIKFAPEEIADKFSYELNQPLQKTFGFHGFHWPPFKETVVIRRSHALGDVLQVEPVLHYFHKKGFNVALDTSDYFLTFFRHHYFPVWDAKQLNPNLPVRVIDLNMAYEVFPRDLHLKSYYKFAGIEDGEIRNPILSLPFNYKHPHHKLFKKYAILHIDERNEPHRNIYGVDWEMIVECLNQYGYDVIQLGNGKHEEVSGALYMNTPTTDGLMWAVASADLFIGIDSGISHIASGFDIPSLIFSGSVDMNIIHPDLKNIVWVHRHHKNVCSDSQKWCWHGVVGESGQPCAVNEKHPPCTQFETDDYFDKLKQAIKMAEQTPKYQ